MTLAVSYQRQPRMGAARGYARVVAHPFSLAVVHDDAQDRSASCRAGLLFLPSRLGGRFRGVRPFSFNRSFMVSEVHVPDRRRASELLLPRVFAFTRRCAPIVAAPGILFFNHRTKRRWQAIRYVSKTHRPVLSKSLVAVECNLGSERTWTCPQLNKRAPQMPGKPPKTRGRIPE